METPAPKPSRLKKIFRRTLFVLATLVTLVALFVAEEDWRGSRAWRNYKSDMEAKGERFDAARLIPPKVPDAENFAACPYLANAFAKPPGSPGWTNLDGCLPKFVNGPRRFQWPYGLAGDLTNWAAAFEDQVTTAKMAPAQAAVIVLDHLKACEPVLAGLRAASDRRFCRFNLPYADWASGTNLQAADSTLQHLAVMKGLYRVLFLRAEADMVAGRTDEAMADIRLMFRLDDGLKEEPLLISQLVRYATVSILLQPVAEGLAERRWSDAQFRILQDRLGQTDLLGSTVRALYGERDILANRFFSGPMLNAPIFVPRGWNHLEQLNYNRAFQNFLLPRINLAEREINPTVGAACDAAINGYRKWAFLHHRIFAAMMEVSVSSKVMEKAAFAQTDVDLVTVACALERYRLAEGSYPDQLASLSPRFIATLPHDIINGQPLKYRRTVNGKFVLYSVGWNEKDDGGVTAVDKDGHPDRNHGDWVLEYPD